MKIRVYRPPKIEIEKPHLMRLRNALHGAPMSPVVLAISLQELDDLLNQTQSPDRRLFKDRSYYDRQAQRIQSLVKVSS